jgi:AraC family transcriptional activator of mtrCDE
MRIRRSVGVNHDTGLVCGRLHFESVPENLVLAALEDVVVLRVGESTLQARYLPLLHGIREELTEARPGSLAIARNLASAPLMSPHMWMGSKLRARTEITV